MEGSLIKHDRRGRLRYSSDHRQALLAAYDASGMRGPQFAAAHGVKYALRQWHNLEVQLGDGRIEIDNNLVENAIRPTKLGAKNWLFIGCREAGQRAAILYTMVENCRRLGIDTREYLRTVAGYVDQ